jgi:pimeloyl-ACP methyl ester carboxylesterase
MRKLWASHDSLTLPGMEPNDADRSGIALRDHVDAVVAEIDAVDPAQGPVSLVGHSAGAAIAFAAVDTRPDRVARRLRLSRSVTVMPWPTDIRPVTARSRCGTGRPSKRGPRRPR